jgi:hypothetical protein
MKTILIISVFFFHFSIFSLLSAQKFLTATNNVWYYQIWEFEQWEHQAKHIRYFNDNGNIIEHLIQVPDSKNNWLNKYKILYDYNESQLQTAITTQVWSDDNWLNSTKLEILYYDNNLIKERNFLLFKNDKWENDVQFAYEYSKSGNILLEIFSRWTDSLWEPYTKLIYKYDSLDLNTEILNIRFLDSVWVNYGRTLKYFDDKKLLRKSSLFGWDINKNEWFYYEQNLYDYDKQNRMTEWINQQGDNEKWYDTFRETYEYTDFGSINKINKFRSVNYEWKNTIRISYYYDNNQDSTIILMEEWQNNSWINKERRIREDILSNLYQWENLNISIFPNPTFSHLMIRIDGQSYPDGTYEIFNVTGSRVQTGDLSYLSPTLAKIDLINLPHGIYFILFNNEFSSKPFKFIKSR